MSFLNSVNPIQIWIVITPFWYISHQTEIGPVPINDMQLSYHKKFWIRLSPIHF